MIREIRTKLFHEPLIEQVMGAAVAVLACGGVITKVL
jgi:hypothetical protein